MPGKMKSMSVVGCRPNGAGFNVPRISVVV